MQEYTAERRDWNNEKMCASSNTTTLSVSLLTFVCCERDLAQYRSQHGQTSASKCDCDDVKVDCEGALVIVAQAILVQVVVGNPRRLEP